MQPIYIKCVRKMQRRRLLYYTFQSMALLFTITFLCTQIGMQKPNSETLPLKKCMIAKNGSKNEEHRINAIKLKILEANRSQKVYNKQLHGSLKNYSMVLLVQVHNRLDYLQYLVESLSNAKHIEQVLLIFSHDIFQEDINRVIRNIKFCKVMQIFFPYSVEVHPDNFPGDDPKDCPRDIGREKATEIKCQNAEHPDVHGRYREPKFTQIKHHWWWKLNYVFNELKVTALYNGLVVFLEEDHYVVEDFIHVLKLMDEKCRDKSDCHFLGLGRHNAVKPFKSKRSSYRVKLYSENTNLGLAFNRQTYQNLILSRAKEFCEYDDYNWDRSLIHITNICSKSSSLTMIPIASRIFHIGECGIHLHKNDCQATNIVDVIQKVIKTIELYPPTLQLLNSRLHETTLKKSGGWGDKRDQQLCLNMIRQA